MRRNKPFIFPKSPPVSSPAVAAGPAPPDGLAERLTLGALLGLAIAVVSAAVVAVEPAVQEVDLTVGSVSTQTYQVQQLCMEAVVREIIHHPEPLRTVEEPQAMLHVQIKAAAVHLRQLVRVLRVQVVRV